jgi:copper chaperone CopZ
MRFLVGSVLAVVLVGSAVASDVEVKGPHICCKQCVKVVEGILAKVDGVSNVSADTTTKTVKFTAADSKAVAAGLKALTDGGFSGAATNDGKEVKSTLAPVEKGDKLDSVKIAKVHVCCPQCQNAIKGLFKDQKVSFDGKGAQRTVVIEGGDVYAGSVIEALRKAGFNGSVEKK